MKPVICVGHAALDYVYRIEAFPPEPTKVRSLEHIESGGGMAANAAATIARLGGYVALWSRTGGDSAGERIHKLLAAEGVDISHVRTFEHARSSTSAVIVDQGGERLIIGERDHAMPMDASWLPVERVKDAAAVMSDLRWVEGTHLAFTEARAHGVPTLLDVDLGGGGILTEFLGLADYAIFSEPALEAFAPGIEDGAQLEKVLALGVRHAGVTRGAGGYSWLSADGGQGHQPAFQAEIVDTTGAGDAFHGAFAWALASGYDTPACARIAAATAALKCRRLGARAGLPTRAELEDFLARVD
ncbi:PfkB family carbohydrate kinase [Hyphomicrobium sp. NDB2Meth4]|uniref:PfkB family carbohydrate kinase n=1 Tax=Hyphomicrobium sp. NDB2Meth4 TaxID=1892846 RepID=UPI000930335D|nr:PfkB family carbohydrate kinase [Hyphomicrobium sp. NDB2Meth4]